MKSYYIYITTIHHPRQDYVYVGQHGWDGPDGKLKWFDVKQVEVGYQCFRRKHPNFPENSFRRHCWVRGMIGSTKDVQDEIKKMFKSLGWKPFTDSELNIYNN